MVLTLQKPDKDGGFNSFPTFPTLYFGSDLDRINTMDGRAEARKVVEDMGKQNGYMSPDLLDTMVKSLPPEAFEDVSEVVRNLKHHAAASVKTYVRHATMF